MITCTINGQNAIPSLKNNIKITMENPHLKNRDSWSMDIAFPMDIHSNAVIFQHCNRLQVARRVQKYDDCILYADNILVIRGIGIVTEVSESEVKLQIKSGIQKIAYISESDKVYIDKIYYPVPIPRRWPGQRFYAELLFNVQTYDTYTYAYAPVYDETNGVILNKFSIFYKPGIPDPKYPMANSDEVYVEIHNAAIQPSLAYVLEIVLKHMGYEIDHSDIFSRPLGNLGECFICNVKMTEEISKALPHWTVNRFLDEVQNLFNITFVFDDNTKRVSIKRNDQWSEESVEYECIDEFTTDYDETGIIYKGASNMAYNLSDSGDRLCDDIPSETLSLFDILEYDNASEMTNAAWGMSEKERLTHIFHIPTGWYYVSKKEDGSNVFEKVKFQHLERSEAEGDVIELGIAPVAFGSIDTNIDVTWQYLDDGFPGTDNQRYKYTSFMTNLRMPFVRDTTNGNANEYMTVQSMVENGESPEQTEDERMEVMFLGGHQTVSFDLGTLGHVLADGGTVVKFNMKGSFNTAQYTTDPASNHYATTDRSFAFSSTSAKEYIGQLHSIKKTVENQEQIIIKFIAHEKPDPSKIFLFRNKKYICDKLEINITERGKEEIVTGYFYEILE